MIEIILLILFIICATLFTVDLCRETIQTNGIKNVKKSYIILPILWWINVILSIINIFID